MGYSTQAIGIPIPYTPTFGGFSADPTNVTARYILIGKLCHVYLNSTAGTSNDTFFTVTLPFAAANTAIQSYTAVNVGNGTFSLGRLATVANSSTLNLYPTVSTTSWPSTGNKNCNFSLSYEIV